MQIAVTIKEVVGTSNFEIPRRCCLWAIIIIIVFLGSYFHSFRDFRISSVRLSSAIAVFYLLFLFISRVYILGIINAGKLMILRL